MKAKSLSQRLIRACRYIEESEELPTLSRVAGQVSMSPAYFQKTFTRALGISPRHYADAVRFDRLRRQLRKGDDVTRALYDAGFGSSSRLYEFAGRYLGMTPNDYKKKGQGVRITYLIADSPLGYLLLAAAEKGICSVRLGSSKGALKSELKREFPEARFDEDAEHLRDWVQALVDYLAGHKPWPLLPYDVQATAFQRRVWEWLRSIPSGTTYSYSEAAKAMGHPSAARAVARACATNPLALVIPCHRIVPKAGGVGGYRWNPERKRGLLTLEKNRGTSAPVKRFSAAL
ncbi:MAG TPA: methylated-DNA--[protein]-cysteine S-methyltransferase [Verrucomicrobiae bacterium]|jgi:AraC family transcriptional regulator of adaptative response/methylated-DNA-[protein]-cysteine methyltransferase|nr:methylated-DNA--[protein]-cysteine S-methyltransferase [Verrucomicrobiae bacterium]